MSEHGRMITLTTENDGTEAATDPPISYSSFDIALVAMISHP